MCNRLKGIDLCAISVLSIIAPGPVGAQNMLENILKQTAFSLDSRKVSIMGWLLKNKQRTKRNKLKL